MANPVTLNYTYDQINDCLKNVSENKIYNITDFALTLVALFEHGIATSENLYATFINYGWTWNSFVDMFKQGTLVRSSTEGNQNFPPIIVVDNNKITIDLVLFDIMGVSGNPDTPFYYKLVLTRDAAADTQYELLVESDRLLKSRYVTSDVLNINTQEKLTSFIQANFKTPADFNASLNKDWFTYNNLHWYIPIRVGVSMNNATSAMISFSFDNEISKTAMKYFVSGTIQKNSLTCVSFSYDTAYACLSKTVNESILGLITGDPYDLIVEWLQDNVGSANPDELYVETTVYKMWIGEYCCSLMYFNNVWLNTSEEKCRCELVFYDPETMKIRRFSIDYYLNDGTITVTDENL